MKDALLVQQSKTINQANISFSNYYQTKPLFFNGKEYVDKELFREHILNLLREEQENSLSLGEEIGLEIALNILALV